MAGYTKFMEIYVVRGGFLVTDEDPFMNSSRVWAFSSVEAACKFVNKAIRQKKALLPDRDFVVVEKPKPIASAEAK